MDKPQSDVQRITDYLMEYEPCTAAQMGQALQLHSTSVSNILSRLKKRGMVQHVEIKGRTKFWAMTPEYSELGAHPVRPSVTSWAPNHVRHWMDVAFFGEGRAT